MKRSTGFAVFAAALLLVVALVRALVLEFSQHGVHPTRTLGILGFSLAGVATLLVPLAIAERRSAQRYATVAAALPLARPGAQLTPYQGSDGTGVRIVGPAGEARLVRPRARVGAPVFVTESGAFVTVTRAEDLPLADTLGVQVPQETT